MHIFECYRQCFRTIEVSLNRKLMERVFYQNPYFDQVFGTLQHDFPIPTKQTRDKSRIKEFKKRVIDMLNNEDHSAWPYSGRLMIMISVSCPKDYILKVDVDNFLKLLFDIFKGHVYKDDSQIYYVMADKNIHPANMIGFFAGIREMKEDESPDDYWPALFSSNSEDWKEERLKKFGN